MTAADPAREALVARIRPLVAGWPDDLLDPRHPAFVSVVKPGKPVTWYAVAHSPRQARELREQLLAFVGLSYSDFDGQPTAWDPGIPVAADLSTAFPHAYRLAVKPADAASVSRLLERLRALHRERPSSQHTAPLSLGRLLRDFDLLIRASDWPSAEATLELLRGQGQLTGDQIAGLRLRLLAAQERWGEVLSAPELPALTAQRLPGSVSEAIAAAIFHEHLAPFADLAEAAAHFREQVLPYFGLLFRQRAAWKHPSAARAAAVADAAARPPVPTTPQSAPDPYAAAAEASKANDPAAALRLLLHGPLTPESARLLVEVALDLGTRDAARAAVAAVRGCDASVREAAFSRRTAKALWGELEEAAGDADDALPDWMAWLRRAATGPWPGAAEAATRGAAEWQRPDPHLFAAALGEHVATAFPAIREALPSLLALLLPEDGPVTALGPAYRLLLEWLVLDDDLSPASCGAITELATAVLRAGPVVNSSRNDYKDVVESLAAAWDRLKRPALLDWGLGLLDLSAEHAVHRYADVIRLAQDVAGEFSRVPRLVTSGQRALLRSVCAELGVPVAAEMLAMPSVPGTPPPEEEAATLRKRLGKRSVVLLTLLDRIASSFRLMMRDAYPDARVDVVQEFSGTRRLRDVAEGADVFIVNTFDSKHAATTFVPQHRSPGAATLYPKGKNAARQIDALEDWLRSLS